MSVRSPCVLWAWGCAALVAAADLVLKALADAWLPGSPQDLGVLRLELSHNTGVAFSAGAGLPSGLILGLTVLLTMGLAVAMVRGWLRPAVPAGLMLGGAVANVLDRAVDGRVTDYLALGWWPTFNLADSAIVLGAAVVVWAGVRGDGMGADQPETSGGGAVDKRGELS